MGRNVELDGGVIVHHSSKLASVLQAAASVQILLGVGETKEHSG